MHEQPFSNIRIAVRGGGDLGSGVAYRLHRAGFPVLITELARPLLLRRAVAFGSAVIQNKIVVEGVTARRAHELVAALEILKQGHIPVVIDPEGTVLVEYSPVVIVDARMQKSEPSRQPASPMLVIGLGPGFTAPDNCDAVVETQRGHDLGRVITHGRASADTGEPGGIQGHAADRVLRAPCDGAIRGLVEIGAHVAVSQTIAEVDGQPVAALLEGVLRGLIHDGVWVRAGTKIADIDPRGVSSHCFTISEKALAIGGGVLEAVLASSAVRALIRRGP